MARGARRFDIYLPLCFNDGGVIPEDWFIRFEQGLLARFGGITTHERGQPLRGIWQGRGKQYQDQVIVVTVVDFRPRGSARFIAQLKRELLQSLDQLEILITESALRVH
jgi:hypothetical protein